MENYSTLTAILFLFLNRIFRAPYHEFVLLFYKSLTGNLKYYVVVGLYIFKLKF